MVMADGSRVWIDDRHPIFRRGVAAILSTEGFSVIGESARFSPEPDGDRVDILIFEADGAGLQRAVRFSQDADASLVALVPSLDDRLLYETVEAGASAVLLRHDLSPGGLLGSLRALAGGNTSLPSEMLPRLLDRASQDSTGSSRHLTRRELSVLDLLAEGNDTKQIAAGLSYSERTVKNIVHDVLMKMNCRNRAHAVAQATRQGLI